MAGDMWAPTSGGIGYLAGVLVLLAVEVLNNNIYIYINSANTVAIERARERERER